MENVYARARIGRPNKKYGGVRMEGKRIHNEYGCSPDVPTELAGITRKIRDIIVNEYYDLLVSDKYDWSDMKLEVHEWVDAALAEAHISASIEKRARLRNK